MLRGIITSHICQEDRERLTLILNDRSLGQLSSDRQSNYVISGNRACHLIVGYDSEHVRLPYIREEIRLWTRAFRELQSGGVGLLPSIVHDHHLEPSFLFIADDSIALIWHDRSRGVYLHRNGQLYRLQPTLMPQSVFPPQWMRHADLYAFGLRTDDLVMMLPPEFVGQFSAEQLELILTEKRQLSVTMNELNKLARTYDYHYDQTWMGMEVQRIEPNRVTGKGSLTGGMDPSLSRLQGLRNFAQLINPSRASKVKNGQALIEPPKVLVPPQRESAPITNVGKRSSEGDGHYQFGSWRKVEREQVNPAIDAQDREVRRRTLDDFASRRSQRDVSLDKIRNFTFDPFKKRGSQAISTMLRMWSVQSIATKLLSITLVIVLLLATIWLFSALRGSDQSETQTIAKTRVSSNQNVDPNAKVLIPAKTDLEIEIVVQANALQVRQSPDAAASLVANCQRGDVIVQLAPAEKGWVFVRLKDGRMGYVFAAYLNEKN